MQMAKKALDGLVASQMAWGHLQGPEPEPKHRCTALAPRRPLRAMGIGPGAKQSRCRPCRGCCLSGYLLLNLFTHFISYSAIKFLS